MANTDNPNGFKLISSGTQGPQPVTQTLAASQTITKGDAVIHSSGLVAIAVATSSHLLGVALQSGTTAASVELKFAPGVPWNIFEGQCSGTYAASIRFTACDIEGTTGIMEVNEDATTEDVIQVVGEDPNSEIGANTRVYFVILRSYWYPVLAAK